MILYWDCKLDAAVKALAEQWLADRPEAPGVASREGQMVCIRREHNRRSKQAWNRMVAEREELRALMVCPEISLPFSERALAKRDQQIKLDVKRKSVIGKVASFAMAVTGPTVSEEEAARRLTICRTNECGHLVTKDENEYCGACGCPKWRLAELKTKLRFATLQCACDPPLW